MKKTLILCALLCVCLVAATGCTGTDTTAPAGETTAGTEIASPTATAIVAATPATVDGAVILGQIHTKTMESIEEAFAYVLSGETVEKDDFLKQTDAVTILIDQFRYSAAPDDVRLQTFAEVIVPARDAMVASALAMFEDYETNGDASAASVEQFEADIDTLTGVFGPFTVSYFDAVSEEQFGDDGHAKAALDLLSMHKDLLNGVEESFGAVVLNDAGEQADFEESMSAFSSAAAAFEKDDYLSMDANSQIAQEYDAMMTAFSDYETAADNFLNAFDANGTVTSEEINAYEKAIDALTGAFDTLLESVLEQL